MLGPPGCRNNCLNPFRAGLANSMSTKLRSSICLRDTRTSRLNGFTKSYTDLVIRGGD